MNGSSPAHGDAKRKGAATQSAEVFALARWVGRTREGTCETAQPWTSSLLQEPVDFRKGKALGKQSFQ